METQLNKTSLQSLKQKLTTRFGSEGVQIVSSQRTYTETDAENPSTGWSANMHVLSLAGQEIPLGTTAQIIKEGSPFVEYQHTANLTEWYNSGPKAMEHGYTISQRLSHLNQNEAVVIEVALEGLTATEQTHEDGSSQLNFNDGERQVLSYEKLLVLDAHGQEVPASMQPTDSGFMIAYHDAGAAYPITVDPLLVNQEAKLTAGNDAAANDQFGYSVSISGDSVVVGSYFDDDAGSDSGSLYIFRIAVEMGVVLLMFDSINAELLNGGSATPFTGLLLGTSQNYTFRITNAGENDLDLQTITLGGTNGSEFSLTFPDISSSNDLAQAESLDLTITFSPTGITSDLREAIVTTNSNEDNNPVFSFNISGLGLSNEIDTDGDGLNYFAEFSLSALGYDWQTSQSNLVNELLNNASNAGLFTQSEAAAVNGSAVLSDVNLTTNKAIFKIGLEESLDLQGFTHLTVEQADLSVDGDGNVLIEVDPSWEEILPRRIPAIRTPKWAGWQIIHQLAARKGMLPLWNQSLLRTLTSI